MVKAGFAVWLGHFGMVYTVLEWGLGGARVPYYA